jgi:predicted transcriptional regulator
MKGNLVRLKLLELELTPAQFAKKAGFSNVTAYKILAGHRVSDRNLFKAAKVIKVRPIDLLEDEIHQSPQLAGAS